MPARGPRRPGAPVVVGAVALGLLAASLAGVTVLTRSAAATAERPVVAVPVAGPLPSSAAGVPAELQQPVGEDWSADAAIRAAVVQQQREVSAARAAARRAARAYVAPGAVPRVPASTPRMPVPSAGFGGAGVWVVGDSIAAGVSAAWGGDHESLVAPGARSTTVVPQVSTALAQAAGRPLLVVALGTNDDPRVPAVFRAEVRRLLAAAPGCVVWTTIHRPGGRWAPLNDVLREAAHASGGRLQLAQWDRLATADPSLLQPDGIHPRTGTVYRSIAGLVQQAAQGCP